ncbi:hypothetical protein HYW83_04125 [Candidatus Peregrinibacteria bacterium]|nr:hypothetical protein [Candidatus Peregrinibacteria bacterium]
MSKEQLPSVRDLLQPSGEAPSYKLGSFMGFLRDTSGKFPKAVRSTVAAAALFAAACSSQARVEHTSGLPDAGITAPAEPDAGGEVPVPTGDGGADGGDDGDAGTPPPPPLDTDGDGISNDEEPQGCETIPCLEAEGCSVLSDGRMTGNHSDDDGDGWCKARDNSPAYNPTQTDSDLDGVGNTTDNCEGPNPATIDSDGDGRPDRQVDADGDGHGVCAAAGSDCDDNDATIPGLEVCDSEDNDCDGVADPDCECEPGDTRTTGSDVGACVAAEETCMDDGPGMSHWETTSGATGPVPEACNGIDDDCDDAVDNGVPDCECVPGVTPARDCGSDEGRCETGTQVCGADGTWSECAGQTEPIAETCNGVDEDCDGETDEDYDAGDACRGRGACGTDDPGTVGVDDGIGAKECNAAHDGTRCSVDPGGSANRSSEEIADGRDNDCNGLTDDRQFTVVGGTPGQTARMGDACHMAGVCGDGTYERASDFAVQCNAVGRRGALNPGNLEGTQDGLCNGADDDCDGATDEGCGCDVGETQTCGISTGACSTGLQHCDDGEFGACEDEVGPVAEVLNDGVDNNCNDLVDDQDGHVRGTACQTGVGRCDAPGGEWEYDGAGNLKCSTDVDGSESLARTEVCNVDAAGLGIDDDCDGEVNECDGAAGIDCDGGWPGAGNPGLDCNPGGICGAGQVICDPNNNLRTRCSTSSLATTESCDDLDNDCDGATDEGCANECSDGQTQICGDADGVCGEQRGLQTCQAANDSWSNCVGDRRPGTETCNGADDDCNGVIDNGFVGLGVACDGVGACGAGTIVCKPDGTATNCSTNPGMPGFNGSAERCNATDDDCDGVMDEGMTDFSGRDLGKVGDPCPLPGECVLESVVCDGPLHTGCSTVGRGGVVTERCDGKDNDCDGATDETFDVNAACSVTCPDGQTLTGIRQCMANEVATACSVQLADCP